MSARAQRHTKYKWGRSSAILADTPHAWGKLPRTIIRHILLYLFPPELAAVDDRVCTTTLVERRVLMTELREQRAAANFASDQMTPQPPPSLTLPPSARVLATCTMLGQTLVLVLQRESANNANRHKTLRRTMRFGLELWQSAPGSWTTRWELYQRRYSDFFSTSEGYEKGALLPMSNGDVVVAVSIGRGDVHQRDILGGLFFFNVAPNGDAALALPCTVGNKIKTLVVARRGDAYFVALTREWEYHATEIWARGTLAPGRQWQLFKRVPMELHDMRALDARTLLILVPLGPSPERVAQLFVLHDAYPLLLSLGPHGRIEAQTERYFCQVPKIMALEMDGSLSTVTVVVQTAEGAEAGVVIATHRITFALDAWTGTWLTQKTI